MAHGCANYLQLFPSIRAGFHAPGRAKNLSDPFRHGGTVALGDLLYLTHFRIVKDDLKSLTHIMSINNSISVVKLFQGKDGILAGHIRKCQLGKNTPNWAKV
jgi:hypothetical protein